MKHFKECVYRATFHNIVWNTRGRRVRGLPKSAGLEFVAWAEDDRQALQEQAVDALSDEYGQLVKRADIVITKAGSVYKVAA